MKKEFEKSKKKVPPKRGAYMTPQKRALQFPDDFQIWDGMLQVPVVFITDLSQENCGASIAKLL